MRILHITPAYYPATYWGGPIFSVYALNNALGNFPGVDLKVLTTDSAGPKVTDRTDTQKLNGFFSTHEVIFSRRIAGACVSTELLMKLLPLILWADIVHMTATYSFPVIPTLLVCRYLKQPLVWSPRGAILDAYEWEGSRRRGGKRIWERICNAIIRPGLVTLHVTSEEERHASLARIPHANATVIPNGVETLVSLPRRKWLPQGRLRLIFMGRLSPKKGIEKLLEAMKLIEDDKTVELSIFGTGDEKYSQRLKNLAIRLGLLNRSVYFLGHVDGGAKHTAFLNADLCVIPSHTENFCIVVAEALGHGIPVVASRGTPWAEVEQKGCGLWVDNDPKILVQAIQNIRNRNLEDMGKRGWQWMKDEFDWDVSSKSVLQLYRSFL